MYKKGGLMINYSEINENLKLGYFNKIICNYNLEKKIYHDNILGFKKYLLEMNNFLYFYILIKFNKNLEKNHLRFKEDIKISSNNITNTGDIIINFYIKKISQEYKKTENKIILEAVKFIENNFKNKITLQDISDKFFISKNYLCKLFKIQTGFTFCQYLNITRLKESKKLIKKGFDLEHISYECGFSSHAHFSNNFKKYYLLTPGEYRKLNFTNKKTDY